LILIARARALRASVQYAGPMNKSNEADRIPFPAVVVIAALAVFGMVTLVQWLVGSFAGILRFGLFLVIIVAAGSWVVSAKGKR